MERIEKLKKFLETNAADSFVQHALALEYVKLGDDAAARKMFEELLERDPDYAGSYYHLGKLLERNNATTEAIKVYETGISVTEKSGDRHALGELKSAYEELIG
jgi:Tfp pilus assembly protein PilF